MACAVALLAVAAGVLYAPILGEDWTSVVPSGAGAGFEGQATEADRRFAVWLVARNAEAWLSHPWRLLDPGTCHPVENALALGHPALSLGLLGAPGRLVTGDPIATYVSAVVLQTLLAAFAMCLLVADWTRSLAAGVAAGVLYAFLPGKTAYVLYPFHGDTAWLLLALFFARRLLVGGGAGAVAGTAIAGTLQLAASFYPFLAATCLGLPLAVWLWRTRDAAALRSGPLIGAGVALALGAVALFGPYLAARDGSLGARHDQIFASVAQLWPPSLTSWPCAALALAGLLLPDTLTVPALRRSPRVALVGGALLAAAVATSAGGVYPLLAKGVPGLDTVRVPAFALSGVHLALCLLAGLGAAGLVRRLPEPRRVLAHASIVALVFVDTLRPPQLGLSPRIAYVPVPVRPPAREVAFFDELAELGDRGPLLESPVDTRSLPGVAASSRRVLVQAYHGRRTSSCYNSFVPDAVRELEPLAARLPAVDALEALARRGFTTLVVHPSLRAEQRAWRRRIQRAADAGRGLVPILSRGGRAAYAIRPSERVREGATPRSSP